MDRYAVWATVAGIALFALYAYRKIQPVALVAVRRSFSS